MTTNSISLFDVLDASFRSRISSLILFYLLAYFVLHYNVSAIESKGKSLVGGRSNVCKTKGCIDTAKTFLKNMDKSVKPCHNFYQFACGNFIKNAVLPKGTSIKDTFSITEDIINSKIRGILQGRISDREPHAFKIMQDYYKVCMDTAQIEKNSENDLRDIWKSLHGWPVLEGSSWSEKKFDWKNTTYAFAEMGIDINFLMYTIIAADSKDSTKNIIYIDQASLGTDQEYLSQGLKDKIVQAYFKYMLEFAVFFGAGYQQARKELTQSLKFEIEMAKISLSNVDRSDISKVYTRMRISDLEKNYKGIPWQKYLNNLIKPKRLLKATDEIMIGPKIFFEKIGTLLNKTPKRTIANYLMWSVATTLANKMSERVQNLSIAYNLLYFGTIKRRERWQDCVKRISNIMPIAVGSKYVRNFFDKNSKNEVSAMVTNIRSAYRRIIRKVTWMDSNTKKVALEKLQYMVEHTGFPDELLNDKKIDEVYRNIKINPKSFLKSHMVFNAISLAKTFEFLQKPINKTDWLSHGDAATVNAFYSTFENSIRFPAGILQGLFYSKDRPKYLNYGAIGMLIGHEMTHGFDKEGSTYDKTGNSKNWWDSETKKKFEAKAKDIIVQYNNFRIQEVNRNISGKLTLDENIADNGGYKEAYEAYLKWSKENGPELGLPDLSYSARQLFWLSAANLWCTRYLPEALKNELLSNPHSPGEGRVNCPISNRPEFAVDYNCSVGLPMNPVKKYGIW